MNFENHSFQLQGFQVGLFLFSNQLRIAAQDNTSTNYLLTISNQEVAKETNQLFTDITELYNSLCSAASQKSKGVIMYISKDASLHYLDENIEDKENSYFTLALKKDQDVVPISKIDLTCLMEELNKLREENKKLMEGSCQPMEQISQAKTESTENENTPQILGPLYHPRDKSQPPKPSDAFTIFFRCNRPYYRRVNPGLSSRQIISKMAEDWKNLDDAEKEPYFELQEKDKIRYIVEMKKFEKEKKPKKYLNKGKYSKVLKEEEEPDPSKKRPV